MGEIVRLVDGLAPIALIGPGGIGKTSIALTVLHHDRVKKRFGDNRRFIRCDQFPATRTHFLHRLSKVIGAGVENPQDLTLLRPFLSSKEILITLDNAESILDPQGAGAEDIYAVVEELSQFDNICLCITSRISTIPPDCETFDIPTLSMEAARNTFYRTYKNGDRPDLVDNVLERLDFHPLSITLLATVAHHNKWDTGRLTGEWERRRTGVLHTHHNKSFADTIELSLASPMFQDLGPGARDLLGVVAFFPQGVDEKSLDWLFPAIPNRTDIFDKFCILSLTCRSNGFATMLAPLRDYLRPKDPKSSPLLCATKEHYFSRLSDGINTGSPSFEETRWIASEDVNVEYLLDVFTSVDADSSDVWGACADFLDHLYWHKPRLVILGSKIEALPEDHGSKPRCLHELLWLLDRVRNYTESKRILTYTLKLRREQDNDCEVARTLELLAFTNQRLQLHKEGISQAKEASEIYERLNRTDGQITSLQRLASLLAEDKQVDAAEETASHAINLSSDEPEQFVIHGHHHTLGHIYQHRGETEVAISHFSKALGVGSSFTSRGGRSSALPCLVMLLLREGRFDDAQLHLEHLKSEEIDRQVSSGLATVIQVCILRQQGRFEEAKSEVSRVLCEFEKMGAAPEFLEQCKQFLREVEEKMNDLATSGESGNDGEFLGTILPLVSVDSLCTEPE